MIKCSFNNSFNFCLFVFFCPGANPLHTNALEHTARAYAKEGDVGTVLLEWEGKVRHTHTRTRTLCSASARAVQIVQAIKTTLVSMQTHVLILKLFPVAWSKRLGTIHSADICVIYLSSCKQTHSHQEVCVSVLTEWQVLLSIRDLKAGWG